MSDPSNNMSTATASSTGTTSSSSQRVYPPLYPVKDGELDLYDKRSVIQFAEEFTQRVNPAVLEQYREETKSLTADQERRFRLFTEKLHIISVMWYAEWWKKKLEDIKEVLEAEKEDAFAGTGGWAEIREEIKLDKAGDLERARQWEHERKQK